MMADVSQAKMACYNFAYSITYFTLCLKLSYNYHKYFRDNNGSFEKIKTRTNFQCVYFSN